MIASLTNVWSLWLTNAWNHSLQADDDAKWGQGWLTVTPLQGSRDSHQVTAATENTATSRSVNTNLKS